MLLHYRPTVRGTWRSTADGAGFFNAGPRGKIDPASELKATLAAFAKEPTVPKPGVPLPEEQHAQCRFPARWEFLKSSLGIAKEEIEEQPCPMFDEWRQAFSAEKVSLVYASAYVNSPASMYGHTFLRLHRSTAEGNPLLDYAINLAADLDTKNGLVYAVKGILGGFKGRFFALPYYVKIQEYSNLESRELWEYELSLTPAQTETLVKHTWETRSTHFDYFFQSENCSYFLLELLEVANPDLRLSDQFGGHVIPADTVRALVNVPGLVGRQIVRPSLRGTMLARKRGLSGHELDVAQDLAKGGAVPRLAQIDPARRAAVIDAAYDRLRFKEGFQWPPSTFFETTERELLIARGQTGSPPQAVPDVAVVDAPERGHRTFRVGLGAGTYDGDRGTYQDLSLRLAIHDFLDPGRGYPEDAQLEMGSLRIRFENLKRRALIERLSLLNIVSASPLDRWSIKPSWRVWVGAGQARDLACEGWACSFGGAIVGGGIAARPHRRWLLIAMLDSVAAFGRPFDRGYRLGVGGNVTSSFVWGSWAQTLVEARTVWFLAGDVGRVPTLTLGHAFNLGSRAQLRFGADAVGVGPGRREARVEVLGYF